jgi:hypothetical protein
MPQSRWKSGIGEGFRRRCADMESSMLIRTLCVSTVVATLMATATLPSAYGASPSSSVTRMSDRQTGKFRLPRELKIMWRREEHSQLKAMPKEQRHGWLKRQWAAMSNGQREQKLAELRSKWNSLPADVRQAMLQKKEQRRQARRMQRADNGGIRSSSQAH